MIWAACTAAGPRAGDPFGFVDKAAEDGAAKPKDDALAAWRAGRADRCPFRHPAHPRGVGDVAHFGTMGPPPLRLEGSDDLRAVPVFSGPPPSADPDA